MSSNTVNQRVNFASTKNPLEYPDFLEVQLKSFQDFLQLDTPPEKRKKEGLYKVFAENFPIADTRNNFVLEFLDYYIDPPRYTIDDCIERGLTYSVPLKAKLKLYCTDPDHEDFDTVIQDVFLGPIPYMTDKATFVINGAERVVVSQLHRSPGVFFGQSVHANGTKLYSARIIPFKGSWIEFATDINNVMYAYIDRKKKLPVTTLLRAIGFENDISTFFAPAILANFFRSIVSAPGIQATIISFFSFKRTRVLNILVISSPVFKDTAIALKSFSSTSYSLNSYFILFLSNSLIAFVFFIFHLL